MNPNYDKYRGLKHKALFVGTEVVGRCQVESLLQGLMNSSLLANQKWNRSVLTLSDWKGSITLQAILHIVLWRKHTKNSTLKKNKMQHVFSTCCRGVGGWSRGQPHQQFNHIREEKKDFPHCLTKDWKLGRKSPTAQIDFLLVFTQM